MSEKLPRIDCQELIRALERAGFVKKRQKGSHLHMWREADKKRMISRSPGEDRTARVAARYSS
jgi:YcfA-like protein.